MKATIRLLGKQLILFLFLSSLLNILALEIASSVETSVSGGICADPRFSTRRWTIDGNPYIVTSDAYITAGCVFTIDPGVCVKFQNGAQLQVTGRLNAIGVEENEIKFTSINDTNCDGIANDGVVPDGQKGDWHYLTFRKGGGGYGDATGIFKYCLFSFGGGDWYQYNRGVIVVDTGDLADPLFTFCTIANNKFEGIHANSSTYPRLGDESDPSHINVGHNDFINNDTDLVRGGSSTLMAQDNYWCCETCVPKTSGPVEYTPISSFPNTRLGLAIAKTIPCPGICTEDIDCNDNDPCTDDTCDQATSLCKYDPVPVCGTSTTTTESTTTTTTESTTTTTTESTTTTTTESTTTTTTTIVGPCTIDYITPDRGPKGTEALDLTITGSGFDPMQPVTVSFSGTGITVTDSTVNSETLITAVINIAETAEVVVRTVTVKQGDITCTGQFAVECLTITPAAVTRGIFFPRLRTITISSPEGNFNRTSRVNIEDFIIAIPLKGTITLESMRVLIVVPPRLRRRIDYGDKEVTVVTGDQICRGTLWLD